MEKFLMGNEAIALGALDAGVGFVSGYPGTPSTEVLETVAKYNDGSVRVNAVRALPTWVLVRGDGDARDFFILPLDQTIPDWAGTFALTSEQYSNAKSSYNRTMELLTPGLNKIANYLTEKNASLDPSLGVG